MDKAIVELTTGSLDNTFLDVLKPVVRQMLDRLNIFLVKVRNGNLSGIIEMNNSLMCAIYEHLLNLRASVRRRRHIFFDTFNFGINDQIRIVE